MVWHVYTCIHTQAHIYTIPTIPVHTEILPTGRTLEWVEADPGQPFPVEKEVVCSEDIWALTNDVAFWSWVWKKKKEWSWERNSGLHRIEH